MKRNIESPPVITKRTKTEHPTLAAALHLKNELQNENGSAVLYSGSLCDAPWNYTPESLAKLRDQIAKEHIPRHHAIIIGGKQCYPKRNTKFYTLTTDEKEQDAVMGYNYSNSAAPAYPLPTFLKDLCDQVNVHFPHAYNGVLVNVYNDGSDYIGVHSDKEVLGSTGGVVSLSLGQTRTFRIKNKLSKKKVKDVELTHGDICWMAGDFQEQFTHEIPKQLRRKGLRVSLTFRHHV